MSIFETEVPPELPSPIYPSRAPLVGTMRVGVSDGMFHVDDVLACFLLKELVGNIDILRTKNPDQLDTCDILVGIGGVYAPDEDKFDYHQTSCNETFDESTEIPLSSAGMIWKTHGKSILREWITSDSGDMEMAVEQLYIEIYYNFILEIDAEDNGVDHIKDKFSKVDIENYENHLTISSIVDNMNSSDPTNAVTQKLAFKDAIEMVEKVFKTNCMNAIKTYLAFQQEWEIFQAKYETPADLPSIINMSGYSTWEKILNTFDPGRKFVKFAIHSQAATPRVESVENVSASVWAVKAISLPGHKYIHVVDILPEEQLRSRMTQPDDLLWVHKNLFIAQCKTKEAALEVAELSLKASKHASKPSPKKQRYRQELIGGAAVPATVAGAAVIGLGLGLLLGRLS